MSREILKQVEAARKAGYTPDEIADYIAQQKGIDIKEARQAGYSAEEIIQQVAFPDIEQRGKSGAEIEAESLKAAYAKTPSLQKGLVNLGAGTQRLVTGARQLVGAEDQQAVDEQAAANRFLAEQPGGTVGQIVGGGIPVAVATAPLAGPIAALSAGGRLAAGTGIGAGAGAIEPVATGDSRLRNIAAGAAFGAGGTLAAEGIASLAKAVAPKVSAAWSTASGAQKEASIAAELKKQGIEWGRLGSDTRQAILQATDDALKVDPSLARVARAESLATPVQLTKGQATRDLKQQITEQQLIPESPALKARLESQTKAIRENLEGLGKGGREGLMEAGQAQTEMMRGKLGATKQAVGEAYRRAEAEAGEQLVDPSGILKFAQENPGVDGVSSVLARLRQVGGIDEAGNPVPVKAKDLYQVRRLASGLQKSPTTAYAGKGAKQAVDEAYDAAQIPQYRQAAELRRAQATQFDERAIPSKLTGMRGQEAALPEEKAIETIISRPVKEIQDYRVAAIRGNDERLAPIFKDRELRKQGVQALKDLRASTSQWLINRAGGDNFDAARLVTAYRSLGGPSKDMKIADEKARALLGPKAAAELKRIIEVSKDVAYDAESLAKGSARHNANIASRFSEWLARASGQEAIAEGLKTMGARAAGRAASAYSPSEVQAQAIRQGTLRQLLPVAQGAAAGQ